MARTQSTGTRTWIDHLPFVLLGLRTAVREDSGCCPADLVFGSAVTLPADLLGPAPAQDHLPLPSEFVGILRGVLRSNAPMPFEYHSSAASNSRVPAILSSCSHVFIRVDAVRRPLSPPYDGPFLVLERGPKTFVMDKSGKRYVVTIDRLKPAAVLDISPSSLPAPASTAPPSSLSTPDQSPPSSSPALSTATTSALDPGSWPLPTRYGRRPRPVDRLGLP